jgi:hypothetical protein
MCSITTRNTSADAPKRSASTLAATLDSLEPSGKSPGFGPEFVTGKDVVVLELSITCSLLTLRRCNAYGLPEPIGQSAVSSVCFELCLSHTLKQFV